MGVYINPGENGFSSIRSDIYVDKSMLIAHINRTIGTPRRLSCVSRPRRFGKSFAAQMLCAYYERDCDSKRLFGDLAIADDKSYAEHLNKYDVIYIDITTLKPFTDGYKRLTQYISDGIMADLRAIYPDAETAEALPMALLKAVNYSGTKFICIIDEWDAPVRESPDVQTEYLEFLRALFKSSSLTSRIFAAVYMTGVLPIKKDGSQSAISDFTEYTMTGQFELADYVGFTELEVRRLCGRLGGDFDMIRAWYDGYRLTGGRSIYNPNSVMKALINRSVRSYWTETSSAESLMRYISLGLGGLDEVVAELTGGGEIAVDTNGFANDLVTFKGRDDVLTLLIHLGYLTYDEDTGAARIPNEEIRREFARALRTDGRPQTTARISASEQLIYDTVSGNAAAVAAQIERIHVGEMSPLHANNEQTLRSVIKLAYFCYADYYIMLEELPAGRGYADIAYLPRRGVNMPALIIELKCDTDAYGAIDQILSREYYLPPERYGGEILLVGISYDKNAPPERRSYDCRIIPFKIE